MMVATARPGGETAGDNRTGRQNYTITGDTIHWQNWDFHLRLNSRVGPILSTVTYNDNGTKRQ